MKKKSDDVVSWVLSEVYRYLCILAYFSLTGLVIASIYKGDPSETTLKFMLAMTVSAFLVKDKND